MTPVPAGRVVWRAFLVCLALVALAALLAPQVSRLALALGLEVSVSRVFSRLVLILVLLAVVFLHRRIAALPDLRALLVWDARGRADLLYGVGYSLGPLLVLALILIIIGPWNWLPHQFGKGMARLPSYVLSALVIAVLEEILFRGILLGLCRRAWRPLVAVFVTSLVFALGHPLNTPREAIMEPTFLAGFSALAQLLSRFADPLVLRQIVGYFLVGAILATATVNTGRLYFAMGLHFGWVFFIKADGIVLSRDDAWSSLWAGGNRMVGGVLIWLFLALVLILVHRRTRRRGEE